MKLSVQTKLLGSFLIVVAMAVAVGVVAIVKLDAIYDTTETFAAETVPYAASVGELEAKIAGIRTEQLALVSRAAAGADATALQDASTSLATAVAGVREALLENRALAPSSRSAATNRSLARAWDQYVASVAPLARLVATGRVAAANALLSSREAESAFAAVTDGLAALKADRDAVAARQDAAAADTVSGTRTLVIVLLALATVAGIALALISARRIGGPLRQMLRAARGIAQGDVAQRLEVRSRDELGATAAAFGEMIAYLEDAAEAARRIAAGDLTVDVQPRSERDALGNAFAAMSAELRAALGDRSCLAALTERMESLSTRDLASLQHALAAVATGDLTVEARAETQAIAAEPGRAAGRLAELFNAMLAQLRSAIEGCDAMRARVAAMLAEIARETASVSAAAQQMATTSEESGRAIGEIATAIGELATGAERQVRAVNEARTVTAQVVAATRASSEHAERTAHAAVRARDVAQDGAAAIERASEGMRLLSDVAEQVNDAMAELTDKSERIGGIVTTITAIAEQTNLLALNAAIEAARAGEQGRGFAVVAEEVRKLAEESQEAAASIGKLVADIQDRTARAREVSDAGDAHVEQSVEGVATAREAFLAIQAAVGDAAHRIQEITAAVEEIAERAGGVEANMNDVVTVAEQANASTEQVSASTQQTSASTQEIAASAQEMARAAEGLERLVGQFTLAR